MEIDFRECSRCHVIKDLDKFEPNRLYCRTCHAKAVTDARKD